MVQRMMVDAPSYDYDAKGDETIELTESNADNILNFVNSMM